MLTGSHSPPPVTDRFYRLRPAAAGYSRTSCVEYVWRRSLSPPKQATASVDLQALYEAGATGLEPATSATGRYGRNRHGRLRPGITGWSRHFLAERTGCDRLRPAAARQGLCGRCVAELMADLTTLLRRGGDRRWRQTVERWRTALPVRGSATTNRDSSAHERAETQRRHGLSRRRPRAVRQQELVNPTLPPLQRKHQEFRRLGGIRVEARVVAPSRVTCRARRVSATSIVVSGLLRTGLPVRSATPGVLPSLDAAVPTARVWDQGSATIGRHRFRGRAMRVLVLPTRALSTGMVR